MKIRDGVLATFKAVPFMASNGLLIWFLPAFILTIILSFGAFSLIDMAVDYADTRYTKTFGEHSLAVCGDGMIVMDCIEEIIRALGSYMLSIVVWIGLFWLKVKLMKYLVLIFLGPVMAMLSELTEQKITGVVRPFTLGNFLREVFRGIRTALLYLFIELCLAILLLIVALVVGFMFPILLPVIAPIELCIAFVMGAFFYGAASMDYVWEREGAGAVESIRMAFKSRRLAIGLGSVFAVLMAIPIVSFTLAPIFAPAITAVAASLVLKGSAKNVS
jgi:uncharacterized protein involved in cysteine biosynthesis